VSRLRGVLRPDQIQLGNHIRANQSA
jgi:flagellar basal body L-ring protein FlgH